jgi:hypothetical protein
MCALKEDFRACDDVARLFELLFASVLNTKNTTTEYNKTVRAQSHLVDINRVYMYALNGRNK